MARKNSKDFVAFLEEQLESDPESKAEIEKERLNAVIAELIYRERKKARLTQQQLADKIGTHQSVIARLEDADYGGHSLSMLWKIADTLNCRLRLEFEQMDQPSEIQKTEASLTPEWIGSRKKWTPAKVTMPDELSVWAA